MRKFSIGFFVILCCSALLASGCAKKELVKGEGEAPGASTSRPTEAPAPKSEMKEEKVQEPAVKEAPVTSTEETKSSTQPMVSLDNIYFDFDSFILTANARETLSKNAQLMMKEGSINVQIAGNCDERGSDEYNLALGEKRAKAALSYMTTLGVPAARLSTISYGKEKPIDPGHDEAAWAKNRNDQFAIIIK